MRRMGLRCVLRSGWRRSVGDGGASRRSRGLYRANRQMRSGRGVEKDMQETSSPAWHPLLGTRCFLYIQVVRINPVGLPVFPDILRIDVSISSLFPYFVSSSKRDADDCRRIAHLDDFMLFERLAFVLLGSKQARDE